MTDRMGLSTTVVDPEVRERTVQRFREQGIVLPTFAQLAEPDRIPPAVREALAGIDPDAPHPLNLFRVHWFNAADRRGMVEVPGHLVLPPELTGVPAPIVVLLGSRFPMIGAHKVLAAYACLVPRLVTGQFDPEHHRAVWPSTGNYCRGGVAISRILGCRSLAVLPEGMSAERFHWLERWVADPDGDILRTPGTESNVKEIYDACNALDEDDDTMIFNQFSEFGNHLAHYLATGSALARVFEALGGEQAGLRLAAFVSATGSAGTLGAGDLLKERYGTKIVAAEALECPTLLEDGFGEHNIQGIGDKHVPLIHHVGTTDLVTAVSDQVTDRLFVLFQSEAGRRYLAERRGVPGAVLDQLGEFGLSGICNLVASIETARYLDLGPDDVVVTVATDSGAMYASEAERVLDRDFGGEFDLVDAAETFGRGILGAGVGHLLELDARERRRIFNLGYYTWVEQQGLTLEEFEQRRDPAWWRGLHDLLPAWDALIDEMNRAAAC